MQRLFKENVLLFFFQRNQQAFKISKDPDEMHNNVAFHQDLHCLLR